MSKREPPGEDSAPGLSRLPPGRHGLPRSFVEQNQRGRLIAGTIAAVAERGYHEATITDISAAAGVSRRTFYAYFPGKPECFAAAYDELASFLESSLRDAAQGTAEWPEQLRAQLTALLQTFAANPDLARFALIAAPGAGGEPAARYGELLGRLFAALTAGEPPPPAVRGPSRAVADGLLGGLVALIVTEVKEGRGEELAALAPGLLELFLAPYYGREEAVRLARGES